jgi:F420-dependent oxidoreductase-like protein
VTAMRLASHAVRLGFYMGYAPPGTNPTELVALAHEAERLGYDSAWAAEAWGTDAVTVLAWLAATTSRIKVGSAILQIPARTPANTAMTAATLDLMSGGRFLLGLGTSGPQVVEGWHGQPWGKPLARTREYVEIVRAVLRRDVVAYHGEHYDVPYAGPGATGLGKPLKLMARPLRAEIPIYLASLRPRSVELAAEVGDGWLPLFFSPERARATFPAPFARKGLDIVPSVPAVLSDDAESARDALKPYYALYVGGMGARGSNFYNDLARSYGYEADAERIQALFLDGRQREAAAAVPDALVDEMALVGPRKRIADRLSAWRESGATTLLVSTRDVGTLRALAELVL